MELWKTQSITDWRPTALQIELNAFWSSEGDTSGLGGRYLQCGHVALPWWLVSRCTLVTELYASPLLNPPPLTLITSPSRQGFKWEERGGGGPLSLGPIVEWPSRNTINFLGADERGEAGNFFEWHSFSFARIVYNYHNFPASGIFFVLLSGFFFCKCADAPANCCWWPFSTEKKNPTNCCCWWTDVRPFQRMAPLMNIQ